MFLLFIHSVVSESLWPHGLQHTRLPCPLLFPGVCSNSYPLSQRVTSNHLILHHPLLLLPSIFPSIRVFSSKSVLCIRWPEFWSFSFSISPSNEYWTSLVAQMVKRQSTMRERVGKIPWRRKWQSTPGLLPGKSHGQRSLVGYSPRGRKESDTTERLHFTSLHDGLFATPWSIQFMEFSRPEYWNG